MEAPKTPDSYQDRIKKYGEVLMAEGLAVEVRLGRAIDVKDYTFVQGDEFAITTARDALCRFLALPMYIDNFATHPERVKAFNEKSNAGALPQDHKELYFHNKLRTNRLLPVLGNVDVFKRGSQTPNELKLFVQEQLSQVDLDGYAELSTADKIQVVRKVEVLAIAMLNKMIEVGLLDGPYIEPSDIEA